MKKITLILIGLLIGLASFGQNYQVKFGTPFYTNWVQFKLPIKFDNTILIDSVELQILYDTNYYSFIGHSGPVAIELSVHYHFDTLILYWHGTPQYFNDFVKLTTNHLIYTGCDSIKFITSKCGLYYNNVPYLTNYNDTTLCIPVGINEITNNFKYYPNPTTDYVYFDKEYKNIKVYSICGFKLNEYYNMNKIDLSEYKSGLYIVSVDNKTIKIIKQQ